MKDVTIALIEENGWPTDLIMAELLRLNYRVIPCRLWHIGLRDDPASGADLILTRRSRWELDNILPPENRPAIVTTSEWDLKLRERIDACTRTI